MAHGWAFGPPAQHTSKAAASATLSCPNSRCPPTCTEVSPFCSTARAAAEPALMACPPMPSLNSAAAAGSSRDTRLLTGLRRPRKVDRLRLATGVNGGEQRSERQVEQKLRTSLRRLSRVEQLQWGRGTQRSFSQQKGEHRPSPAKTTGRAAAAHHSTRSHQQLPSASAAGAAAAAAAGAAPGAAAAAAAAYQPHHTSHRGSSSAPTTSTSSTPRGGGSCRRRRCSSASRARPPEAAAARCRSQLGPHRQPRFSGHTMLQTVRSGWAWGQFVFGGGHGR